MYLTPGPTARRLIKANSLIGPGLKFGQVRLSGISTPSHLTPDPIVTRYCSLPQLDQGSRAVLWFAIELERTTEATGGRMHVWLTGSLVIKPVGSLLF